MTNKQNDKDVNQKGRTVGPDVTKPKPRVASPIVRTNRNRPSFHLTPPMVKPFTPKSETETEAERTLSVLITSTPSAPSLVLKSPVISVEVEEQGIIEKKELVKEEGNEEGVTDLMETLGNEDNMLLTAEQQIQLMISGTSPNRAITPPVRNTVTPFQQHVKHHLLNKQKLKSQKQSNNLVPHPGMRRTQSSPSELVTISIPSNIPQSQVPTSPLANNLFPKPRIYTLNSNQIAYRTMRAFPINPILRMRKQLRKSFMAPHPSPMLKLVWKNRKKYYQNSQPNSLLSTTKFDKLNEVEVDDLLVEDKIVEPNDEEMKLKKAIKPRPGYRSPLSPTNQNNANGNNGLPINLNLKSNDISKPTMVNPNYKKPLKPTLPNQPNLEKPKSPPIIFNAHTKQITSPTRAQGQSYSVNPLQRVGQGKITPVSPPNNRVMVKRKTMASPITNARRNMLKDISQPVHITTPAIMMPPPEPDTFNQTIPSHPHEEDDHFGKDLLDQFNANVALAEHVVEHASLFPPSTKRRQKKKQ